MLYKLKDGDPIPLQFENKFFDNTWARLRDRLKESFYDNQFIGQNDVRSNLENILQNNIRLAGSTNDAWSFYNYTFVYATSTYWNWNIYKKIYQYDKDMFEMLSNSDISKINCNMIKERLPFKSFFIDNQFTVNTKDGGTDLCVGAFVSVVKDDNPETKLSNDLLAIVFVLESGLFIYAFIPLIEEEINMSIEYALAVRDNKIDEVFKNFKDKEENSIYRANVKMLEDSRKFNSLMYKNVQKIIGAIVYLCADNKEIKDYKFIDSKDKKQNKINKIYRDNAIQKTKVGFRMGATIRKSKKKTVYVYDGESSSVNEKHQTKSSHMRCGHYHSFWVGSRNSEDRHLILHFIPPIWVNGGKDTEKEIVIHKIKE